MAGIIESSPARQNFSRYDIHVIIKLSVILGKDVSCIQQDLVTVLGENAPSIQTVRKWVKSVTEGRDDIEDELVLADLPAIRKKRPGLLQSGILFHHDNAPVHTARAVTDVLAGYKWELLEHPRYTPDLAPCDFHLFPKMKKHLRGQRFKTEEDIIQATKVAIKNLDKCSYVTAFKDWLQRIEKCANNGECYVE
ncbi:mariner transposase [Elysia marginata]|uniref:Mariner transposase n=1 Tax=Elysia marginata TaxID=1093978 RepID=A0AAV4H6S5_9GAST|nr:mariner transposase [Elysia marginata]